MRTLFYIIFFISFSFSILFSFIYILKEKENIKNYFNHIILEEKNKQIKYNEEQLRLQKERETFLTLLKENCYKDNIEDEFKYKCEEYYKNNKKEILYRNTFHPLYKPIKNF